MTAPASEEVTATLARSGFAALVIKIGAAGLSFLMFLLLARAMSAGDYGRFGFGFALATFLAYVGLLGRHHLALRFGAIYRAEKDGPRLNGLAREGYASVFLGCGGLGLILVLAALVFARPGEQHHLLWAGFLTVALGWAEYQSHLLRTVTGMWVALAPRDLCWRALVIALAAASALGFLPRLDAASGLLLLTLTLAAMLFVQAGLHPLTRPGNLLFAPAAADQSPLWRRAALGLWGNVIVQTATPNLAVVGIGLLLTPAETGPFFAALRTAMLLSLFSLAASMVATPLLAARLHAGDTDGARRICAMVAAGVGVPTLLVFLALLFWGGAALALFNEPFAREHPVLTVLAAGYLVNALAGPTAELLAMAGHERALFKIMLAAHLAALVALPLAILAAGPMAAALVLASAQIGWNLIAWRWARTRLGIDTSIFALRP